MLAAALACAVLATLWCGPGLRADQTAGFQDGNTITISVTADGTQPFTYQWQKDGASLTDGGNIAGATTATLTLSNATSADEGDYSVVVTNSAGSTTSDIAILTYAVIAPAITTQPAAQTVPAGDTVVFTVVAFGTPAPSYQWRKNGAALVDGGNVSGATTATLTLTGVTAAEAGTYSVVATNPAGSDTSNDAVLTVNTGTAPAITTQPVDQTVDPGATVTFTATASGAPAPAWQWSKDGTALANGGNVAGATTGTLTLTNVTSADAGTYTVMAANLNGSVVSSGAVLTVNTGTAPVITTQPADQTADPGTTVIFIATASGAPAPSFQWYKNGVALTDGGTVSGATSGTLVLTSITATDGAAYSVVATNVNGAATSSQAVLTVNIPPGSAPVIIAQPASQTVNTGATVTFTIDATGDPAPSFQWRKNGSDISGATSGTLILGGVTVADAATYSVVVANSAGTVVSNDAILAVNPVVAPVITRQPASQTVSVGTTVSFFVTATGAPDPWFQWRKNGVPLSDSGNVSGSTDDTLVLSSVTTADAGTYTVVATNAAGAVTSKNAVLTVSTGTVPVITAQPSSKITNAGATVTFTVAASGTPTPTIQWRKDGVALTNGGTVSGATTNTLTLTGVTSADAATYSAVATNLNGSATSNGATLALSGLPVITLNPVSQTVVVGDTVTFTVAATGTPAPSFQWRQNGRNLANTTVISGATGGTLTLVNVPLTYAGTYTALAINLAGTVVSTGATLTVYAPPSVGTLPSTLVVLAGGDLPLNVVVDGFPAPVIQWQKNGTVLADGGRISGTTDATLLLSAATPADSGVYTITATNLLGTVSASIELLVLPDSVGYQVASPGHEVALSYTGAQGTLQWQVSTDGGAAWTNLTNGTAYSGVTGDTLRILSVSAAQSFSLYRLVSTENGTTTTVYEVMLDVAEALLAAPAAVSADGQGNLFVTDTSTDSVKKITGDTQISTFAGTDGQTGTADGTGSAARFNNPGGVAAATDGTVAVADTTNDTLRVITAAGVVSTLAGTAGSAGSTDSVGAAARFSTPTGLARDTAGNLYVGDTQNHTLRKVTTAGSVTTFAGRAGFAGNTDDTGTAARFNQPTGVAIDATGNLYVADTGNNLIRKITASGVVTTLAGVSGVSGADDGTGTGAKFNQPAGVAVDASGNVFVADTGNSTVRRITPAGAVTTFAGTAGTAGLKDGTGTDAWFNHPLGLGFDTDGTLYVADTGNGLMRRISSNGVVRTLALYPPASTETSGTITLPDTPDTTTTPDTTDTPTTSTDTPATPDTPDTTATPDTPDTPTTSTETPATPDTPTTPTVPTTSDTTTTSSGGGGGGAPSLWFLGALALLWRLRRRRARR